jgi:bacteriorhodopsin
MITTIPLLMYFIKILDYRFTIIGGYITDVYLNHYYIEWLFTTPLILMQFAIVGNLGIYRLLGLVTMDILMILCGYMSYIVSDYETKKTLFAIGCLNFLAISAGTLYGPQQGLKRTAQCVLCLWTLYPVIHFMYLLHHIQIYSVVFIFTMLDILVKGIVLNGTLSLYYFPVIYQQLP